MLTTSRRLILLLIVIVVVCSLLSITVAVSPTVTPQSTSSSTSDLIRIDGFNDGNVPHAWSVVGAANASMYHEVTFGFAHENSAWLAETFAAVSNPTHARYQEFPERQTMINSIAPSQSTRNTVIAWLYASGIKRGVLDHGIAVTVVAAVSDLNALFNCTLMLLNHTRNHQSAIRAFGTCWMPATVFNVISAIDGLVDAPSVMNRLAVGPSIKRSKYTPPQPHPHALDGAPSETPTTHSFHTLGNGCPGNSYYPVVSPHFLVARYNMTDRSQSTTPIPQSAATLAGLLGVSYNATALAYYGAVYLQYTYPFAVNNIGPMANAIPSADSEGSLDASALLSINPTSNNSVFFASTATGMNTFYQALLAYLALPEPPSVLSITYEFDTSDLAYNQEVTQAGLSIGLNATDTVLMMLGAMGVTVIVGSGDDGAPSRHNPTCNFNNNTAGITNVAGSMLPQYPASSPYVLTVGATDFLQGSNEDFNAVFSLNNNYVNYPYGCNNNPNGDTDAFGNPLCYFCQANVFGEQAVSNNDYAQFTSGGGFSQYAARPSWQNAAVTNYLTQCTAANGCNLPATTDFNSQNRAYPDVAMYGAGYLVGYPDSDANKPPTTISEGGTSLSAPLFAAVVSRLNEVATALTGKTLGFINPLLYQMSNNQPNTFNDITVGNNICPSKQSTCAPTCEGYYATSGWDAVTGLGSPNVGNMMSYITNNLQPALSSTTTVVGDPQITGFNKQSFQVHGISGQTYNIITTKSVQFNAEFIFLSNGRCPDELAARTECYGHPGTYIGTAAIRISNGYNNSGEEIIIQVESGTFEHGFTVTLNGQRLLPSDQIISFGGSLTEPLVTVKMDCAFVLELTTANYTIRLDNSDSFLNQRVSMRSGLISHLKRLSRHAVMTGGHKRDVSAGNDLSLPHGLLGQTWSTKTYPNQWKHIEGTVEHYHVLDGVTGTDFEFNRYQI